MRIQILSDLHLEYATFEPVWGEADVVVLAGDIAFSSAGIAWARQAWPDMEIVYVPGNHEYYRSEIGIENEIMEQAASVYGVHVLNRDEVVIGGVRFLGATLWTDFLLFGEEERPWAIKAALSGVADYREIDLSHSAFVPQDALNMHRADVGYLDACLKHQPYTGKTVVVTHHAPSMRSIADCHHKSMISACYASHLEYMMGEASLWVHGHTHDSCDYYLNGTRVVCNPRGYCKAGEAPENLNFNPTLVVTI